MGTVIVTQDQFNNFVFPPPSGPDSFNNSVFTLGDVLNVSWVTQFPKFRLEIYQQLGDSQANGPVILADSFTDDSFVWTVTTTGFSLGDSDVFFFRVQDLNSSGIFGSSYLNFTDSGAVQSFGFVSPASATISSTSFSSTLPSQTSSVPSSVLLPSTSSAGLSTGAKAGIGVGAAVAFLALVAAISWYFYVRKRRGGGGGKIAEAQLPQEEVKQEHPMELDSQKKLPELFTSPVDHKEATSQVPVELSG